ncbi:MAG: OmpA family protein [Bacteroidia bacterium]
MFKNYIFVQIGLAITIAIIYSCGGSKGSISAARDAYAKKEFFVATENYKKVYSSTKSKEEKIEASFMAAESFRQMNDPKNSENWYRKAIKLDPKNAEAQLFLAQALKMNAKFEEAIVEYKNYQKLNPSDEKRVEREIKGCEYALKWKNEKTRYIVENVKALNTRWSDFAVMYFGKNELYFTSDREKGVTNNMYGWTGNGYTDLYRVEYKVDRKNPNDIKYQIPVLVDKEKLNGKYNDGVIAFDNRYTTAYFTKCNYANSGKGNFCQIFMSQRQGTEWGTPELLPFSADSFSCGHPTLSKDGQTMIFSSDMPGGYGGKDLWMVTFTKRTRTWGDPVNLGPNVNTAGDEMYPFLHEDGTLYFSSNGHVGLGGLDIFYTTGEGTEWGDPVNMKSPINSAEDDFAIAFERGTKERGYFSSTREGGRGQDDIYRFYMTPLVFTLSGVVRDQKTNQILPNSIITITSSSDTGRIILKTDNAGSYKITIKEKTDYELFAAKQYYYDSKLEFQTTKGLEVSTDLIQDFVLIPFNFDSLIKLEGIYYGLDSADIRPASKVILDELILTLNKYPNLRIELGSHTDCRADSLYNIKLSQRRADSAVNYLVSRGIDIERLVAKGYGENMLAVKKCSCEGPNTRAMAARCTEEEHQLNRRTTVKFLDLNYNPKAKGAQQKDNVNTQPGGQPPSRIRQRPGRQ